MNAVELFHQDGRSAGVYYCGRCRIVRKTVEQAESCCQPRHCEKCGNEIDEQYRSVCEDCRHEERMQKETERLAKAELVEYEGGWVFSDAIAYNNGYFESMGDLLDHIQDEEPEQWPEFAYLTSEQPFAIDYDRVIEDAESQLEWDSDWGEPSYTGEDELRAAIEKFNEANKSIKTYWPDYGRKVKVPRE